MHVGTTDIKDGKQTIEGSKIMLKSCEFVLLMKTKANLLLRTSCFSNNELA